MLPTRSKSSNWLFRVAGKTLSTKWLLAPVSRGWETVTPVAIGASDGPVRTQDSIKKPYLLNCELTLKYFPPRIPLRVPWPTVVKNGDFTSIR